VPDGAWGSSDVLGVAKASRDVGQGGAVWVGEVLSIRPGGGKGVGVSRAHALAHSFIYSFIHSPACHLLFDFSSG